MTSKRETTSREIAVFASGDLTPALWLQQPVETPEEYALFKQFREMPIRKLQNIHGTGTSNLQAISNKFKWHERVLAYDRMLEEGALALTKEALAKKMTDAATNTIAVVQMISELSLNELRKHKERSFDPSFAKTPALDVKELAKIMTLGKELFQTVTGQPTEIVRHEHEHENLHSYDNLTLEEIKMKKMLEDKAAGKP
jgi:hypothetical protein